MPAKARADQLVFEQGLAESREQARRLIMAGKVSVLPGEDRPAALPERVDKPGHPYRCGTRFILTELEYGVPFGKGMERRLERLINDISLVPVLAHIERFPFLLDDPALVAYLREMGCLCQMNLQDFGNVFMKRKMLRLVMEGMVDYLGEDLHRSPIAPGKKRKILSELDRAEPAFTARCDTYARETIFC